LGELLARAGYGGERFILERRGKPLAALISIQDLQRVESIESRETGIKEIGEEYATHQIDESDAQLESPSTTDARLASKTALGAEDVFASLAGIWQHLRLIVAEAAAQGARLITSHAEISAASPVPCLW
jgi:hypothetical protein